MAAQNPDELLNRKCRVTIVVGNPTPGLWFAPTTTSLQDTIVIENMRVKFSTEKHLGKHPNEATITISNLSEATRKALQVKPLVVTLECSYGDGEYAVVFKGDIRQAQSEHSHTDWLTKLQLGDGDRAYSNARVSQTFRGATSGKDVLIAAAAAMGLHVPTSVADATSMAKNFASNGFSLQGPAHNVISDVLDPQDMSWSIQDGQMQVLTETQVIDGNGVVTSTGTVPAIVVSQDTGMVGVPDYSVPKTLGKPPILKVKTLIDARLRPGRLMQLQSEGVHGNFRIEDVKMVGDTHANEWYAEVQAKALS